MYFFLHFKWTDTAGFGICYTLASSRLAARYTYFADDGDSVLPRIHECSTSSDELEDQDARVCMFAPS